MTCNSIETIFADGLSNLFGLIRANKLGELNEATVQHHLAISVHLLALERGVDIQMVLEKRVRLASGYFPKRGRVAADIDLFVHELEGNKRLAVELKLFKRSNHREPNNRYDSFADIGNLELYKKNGMCDVARFVLLTNHPHYYDPDFKTLSASTGDFNLREGEQYTAGAVLTYDTETPYGPAITLLGSYRFKWVSVMEDWKALILEV